MSWVGLIEEPIVLDSDDSVKDPHFFGILRPAAETPFKFHLEVLLKVLLIDVQRGVSAEASKVVTMHHAAQTELRVMEATW